MIRSSAFLLAAGMALLTAANSGADETFPVVHNEPITVRILGGKSGLPLGHLHLLLVGGYDEHDLHDQLFREEAITNAQGQVRLSNQMENLPWLQVWVDKKPLCQAKPRAASFSMEQIRRDGLSSPNHCGTVTVEDAPGVFTVFVKSKKVKVKDPLAKFFLGTATEQAPAPQTAAVAAPATEPPARKTPKIKAKSHAVLLPAPAVAKDVAAAGAAAGATNVATAVPIATTTVVTKNATADATTASAVVATAGAKGAAASATKNAAAPVAKNGVAAVAKDAAAVAKDIAAPASASQQAESKAAPLAQSVAVTPPAPVPATVTAVAPAKVAALRPAKPVARRRAAYRSRPASHRPKKVAAACEAPQPAAKATPAVVKTTSKPVPVPVQTPAQASAKAPEKVASATGKTKPAAGVEQTAGALGKPSAPPKQK